MLSLLGLVLASTPASTGCFNGGAFVGGQFGFTHVKLKQEAKAKDKAITKEKADKIFDVLDNAQYEALDGKNEADKDKIKQYKEKEFDKGTARLVFANIDEIEEKLRTLLSKEGGKEGSLQKVIFYVETDATDKVAVTDQAKKKVQDAIGKEKKEFSEKLVAADGEQKYSSNNGFAGLHAGYLGRVNDKFLVGGLVEGNWVFGQDMKVDKEKKDDVKARFNVNVFLRAMFNLTDKFMAGADLGFSGQEIRQPKAAQTAGDKKTDKESKWFFNPAARLVLGVTLTDNILATAHFGGVFPVMKQDSLDKSVKAKYSNFHGGVGISYVFGG